ncbi:MAG: RluA family pseudouridine synthase [Acidimicrobiia bacterium]|nr:RluA family pseudouridine synthase [Acidimicrobiia bacterium]
MIAEVVPDALDGERLDRFVALRCGCSRSEAVRAIEAGEVHVGSAAVTTRSRRLAAGEVVEVRVDPIRADERPVGDPSVEFDVVHVDDDLIVVDKPAGLVVHPGSGNPDRTLVNGLLARFPELAAVGEPRRPGIVHRLDLGTSGLMLVARSPMAYDELVGELAMRRVHRRYLAVVWGVVEADDGVIDAPIGRSPREPVKMAVVADGREARTAYWVDRRVDDPGVTVVRCALETGRTHQIRVHMAAIGHPLVGDDRYGGARSRLPFGRPALHAAELELAHPVDGRPLHFFADPPADLAALLGQLDAV